MTKGEVEIATSSDDGMFLSVVDEDDYSTHSDSDQSSGGDGEEDHWFIAETVEEVSKPVV